MLVFVAAEGEVSVWRALVLRVRAQVWPQRCGGGSLQQCLVMAFFLEALSAALACGVKEPKPGALEFPHVLVPNSLWRLFTCFEIRIFFLLVHKLFLNL